MKIGTDGTLLGAWCSCEKAINILDIGTGTGLIALMMAQRNTKAKIDAVEINKAAADEAQFNFQNSKWNNRLTIFNIDFLQFQPNKTYNLIVSNPPFFENSTKNMESQKSIARHNQTLTLEDLAKKTALLLSENGVFSIILPVIEAEKLISICEKYNLNLIRKTEVYANTNSQKPIRILLEFSQQRLETTLDKITIEKTTRHDYTEEYKALCKDFFLKF